MESFIREKRKILNELDLTHPFPFLLSAKVFFFIFYVIHIQTLTKTVKTET